jgi:ketosteroid isomerase-like protein
VARQDVELIRRMLAEAPRDPEALYGLVDEDAVWEVTELQLPDTPSRYHGPAAVREFFRRWIGAFDQWSYEVGEVIDAGAAVVVNIRQSGRGKGSGVTVEPEFWGVWTVRGGRIVRCTNHLTRLDALEAAGLSG